MLDDPDLEGHRHRTGHARADFILGGLAVFLSMVSIYIAVRHGETMERLVAANSWPNLQYDTSNENDAGTRNDITLNLRNTGVGPARIESFELFYKDKPMPNSKTLLDTCCGGGKYNYASSAVIGEVLPARESIQFLLLRPDTNRKELWDALNKERFSIRVRACYCSVFDECWMMDSAARRPERAAACEMPQSTQYIDRFNG